MENGKMKLSKSGPKIELKKERKKNSPFLVMETDKITQKLL